MTKATYLTKARINAIIEALTARLAGEIEDTGVAHDDYEKALDWALERRDGDTRKGSNNPFAKQKAA